MNRQEHFNILTEELRKRDEYWQSEIERINAENDKKLQEQAEQHKQSPAGRLADCIRDIIKEELALATVDIKSDIANNVGKLIERHLHIDVDREWTEYSGQTDHDHKVTIDWY